MARGQQLAETGMGAIVLIAAAGFFAYALSAGGKGLQSSGYEVSAKFGQVGALEPGADVRVAGVKVGTVSSVQLDPKTYLAEAHLNLASSVKLPSDSTAKITSDSLLGGSHIAIEPGGASEDLKPGGEIQNTQGAVDLFSLIGQVIRPGLRPRRPHRRHRRAPGGQEIAMRAGFKPWLWVGLAATLVLGAATLVQAQQEGAPAGSPAPAPALKPAEPPPPAPVADHAKAATDRGRQLAPASSQPARPAAAARQTTPAKRPHFDIAVLQALDKVTAETERFEVPLNTPVRYKTLIFTVRACETTASDEDIIDAAAHVEVVSQPTAPEGGAAPPPRQVFKGWMFANSPGLDLLQHPIYDAWLIACKTETPSA